MLCYIESYVSIWFRGVTFAMQLQRFNRLPVGGKISLTNVNVLMQSHATLELKHVANVNRKHYG